MVRTISILVAVILATQPVRADVRRDCAQAIDSAVAIRACTEIIESGAPARSLIDAYKHRSDAYYSSGDYHRAIADLNAAIDRDRGNADLHIKRGLAFEHVGNDEGAIVDYGAAIKLQPRRASIYTMRGSVYERQGNDAAAIADLEKALAIDPSLKTTRAELERLRNKP
jgi:tetratricopeptide (TPR) repeat protein